VVARWGGRRFRQRGFVDVTRHTHKTQLVAGAGIDAGKKGLGGMKLRRGGRVGWTKKNLTEKMRKRNKTKQTCGGCRN
jgi:hypothetical protein